MINGGIKVKGNKLVKWSSLYLVVFYSIVGSYLIGQEVQTTESVEVINWDRILRHFNAYVDNPSKENALELLKSIPPDRVYREVGDGRKADRIIFGDDYVILYEEAVAGDRVAVEILFRFLNITDGGRLEMVMSDLGLIIRLWPRLFLEVLSKYKDISYVKRFGWPVSFIGMGHNMHPVAEIHILKKRIEALSSVDCAEYNELKQACIKTIEERIKQIESSTNLKK